MGEVSVDIGDGTFRERIARWLRDRRVQGSVAISGTDSVLHGQVVPLCLP
jgi:hypothetical protein